MKNIVFVISLCIAFATNTNAQTEAPTYTIDRNGRVPVVNFQKSGGIFSGNKVEVPAGTMVIMKTMESIKSEDAVPGKIIRFLVDIDVMVCGKEVISSNAIALGRIKSVSPATSTSKEEIIIEVTSVQSVDGQQVPLHGQEDLIWSRMPGESVAVPSGKVVVGYFKNKETIKV
ncbi:MAG TPA: hypothetical protein ENJ95_17380 [Bacteroidetes bacterium]|nr:hypothetical protein [Bacteroidota bacterium]